jgi:hypothetical protein
MKKKNQYIIGTIAVLAVVASVAFYSFGGVDWISDWLKPGQTNDGLTGEWSIDAFIVYADGSKKSLKSDTSSLWMEDIDGNPITSVEYVVSAQATRDTRPGAFESVEIDLSNLKTQAKFSTGCSGSDTFDGAYMENIVLPVGGTGIASFKVKGITEVAGSCEFRVSYNKDIVTVESVDFVDMSGYEYISNDEGYTNIIAYSGSGVTGNFTAVDILFKAVGPSGSSSNLSITNFELLSADPIPTNITVDLRNGLAQIGTGVINEEYKLWKDDYTTKTIAFPSGATSTPVTVVASFNVPIQTTGSADIAGVPLPQLPCNDMYFLTVGWSTGTYEATYECLGSVSFRGLNAAWGNSEWMQVMLPGKVTHDVIVGENEVSVGMTTSITYS